jgi:hypothetical protein
MRYWRSMRYLRSLRSRLRLSYSLSMSYWLSLLSMRYWRSLLSMRYSRSLLSMRYSRSLLSMRYWRSLLSMRYWRSLLSMRYWRSAQRLFQHPLLLQLVQPVRADRRAGAGRPGDELEAHGRKMLGQRQAHVAQRAAILRFLLGPDEALRLPIAPQHIGQRRLRKRVELLDPHQGAVLQAQLGPPPGQLVIQLAAAQNEPPRRARVGPGARAASGPFAAFAGVAR